jgi:hypothetical protein
MYTHTHTHTHTHRRVYSAFHSFSVICNRILIIIQLQQLSGAPLAQDVTQYLIYYYSAFENSQQHSCVILAQLAKSAAFVRNSPTKNSASSPPSTRTSVRTRGAPHELCWKSALVSEEFYSISPSSSVGIPDSPLPQCSCARSHI